MIRHTSIVLFIICTIAAVAAPSALDKERSRVVVRVFRAGIFGSLGDNHEIVAPVADAKLDESAGTVSVRFDARQLRVLDPNLSPEKRNEVQERMLGPEVLDPAHFPEIAFQSTSVQKEPDGRLLISGILHLHGQAHLVSGSAVLTSGAYDGRFRLKQRDFGIKPVSIAGGTIKVKDEISIEFHIQPQSARQAASEAQH